MFSLKLFSFVVDISIVEHCVPSVVWKRIKGHTRINLILINEKLKSVNLGVVLINCRSFTFTRTIDKFDSSSWPQ